MNKGQRRRAVASGESIGAGGMCCPGDPFIRANHEVEV